MVGDSLLVYKVLAVCGDFQYFHRTCLVKKDRPGRRLCDVRRFLRGGFVGVGCTQLRTTSILIILFIKTIILVKVCLTEGGEGG